VNKSVTHAVSPDGAGGFDGEFLKRALSVFGRNDLWLLISVVHHGWRAHADMVHLLVGERPLKDATDEEWHAFEHRSLAALEEIFLLVDQLYRLVSGIRSHLAGEDFLTAYCSRVPDLKAAYDELSTLSTGDWEAILPLPDRGELVRCLEKLKVPGEIAAEMLQLSLDLHGLCAKNMVEIAVFFERVPSPVDGVTNCSLRDMNNRYRHGTRILYGDCDPLDVPDIVTNPDDRGGMLLPMDEVGPDAWEETVDILISPGNDDSHAHTAKSRYSREWCDSLVLAAANLGVLMRRLAAGFLRSHVDGEPSCAPLAPFQWEPLESCLDAGGV
jgi:hypothetical protein